MKSALAILIQLIALHTVMANVKPNSLFTDHMALQEGTYVPVWGTADDGEQVTVQFNGQTVSTTAENGKWLVKLSPMDYLTAPTSMIIKGNNTVIIKDILIGEVWLCSGQSNMERQLGPRPPQPLIKNWENERDAAHYPLIREFYVPEKYSSEKLNDVNGRWTVCSPQTVSDFSAVGYFFARDLYQHQNVPVGIIFSAYGGTIAEDWTSKTALESNPKLVGFVKNYDAIQKTNWHPKGEVMSGLYNAMIYPLIPLSIKGVAWYQGETNNVRPKQYQTVLTNMIHNWREDFGQGDFPFLIVQITPHKDMPPELRESQFLVSQKVKNTALIVTTDCGDSVYIHAPHKQPVGARLALAARHLAYGEQVEYEGPNYQSYKIKGNKIILNFSHVGKGLTTKGSGKLKGFTIAADDKRFVPATAKIEGQHIVVYSDSIQNPVAVRYGWSNVPDVNLFNKNGIPASPFRTDHNK